MLRISGDERGICTGEKGYLQLEGMDGGQEKGLWKTWHLTLDRRAEGSGQGEVFCCTMSAPCPVSLSTR